MGNDIPKQTKQIDFTVLNQKTLQKYQERVHFAYDNTIVSYSKLHTGQWWKQGYEIIYTHKKEDGTIIHKLDKIMAQNCQELTISPDEIVIATNYRADGPDSLVYWNLRLSTVVSVSLNNLFDRDSISPDMFYFRKRNAICVYGKPKKKNGVLLLYYSLPLTSQSKPFHTFHYQKQRYYSCKKVQLNNDSMVGFYSPSDISSKNRLIFDAYVIRQYQKYQDVGTLYQIKKTLDQDFNSALDVEYRIFDIWQIRPLQFFVQIGFETNYRFQIYKYTGKVRRKSYNYVYNKWTHQIKQYFFNPSEQHIIQFVNEIRTINWKQRQFNVKKIGQIPMCYVDGTKVLGYHSFSKVMENKTNIQIDKRKFIEYLNYWNGNFQLLIDNRDARVMKQIKISDQLLKSQPTI